MQPRTRGRLAWLHRWLAIVMAPVFGAILLSGAVLAFRPILGTAAAPDDGHDRLDPRSLEALLARVDPEGKAPYLFLTPDERTVGLMTSGKDEPAYYHAETGLSAPAPIRPAPDVFEIALRIHRDLWFDLGGLVGFGTFAMLVLVLLGPILARPARSPTTYLGRHIWLGWALWPLLALLPVSVVLMKLHAPAVTTRNGPPLALERAIEIAAQTVDLSRLRAVQALPGGSAMVFTAGGADGPSRYVIRADGVHRFESPVSKIGRALHAGTWGGPWSGAVNLAAALMLFVMMGLGLLSWSRGRGGSSRVAPASTARELEPAPR